MRVIAAILPIFAVLSAPASDSDADSKLLRTAGVTDGASALALLRERATRDAKPEALRQLLEQLADSARRDAATARLAAFGNKALPTLQEALKKPELAKSHDSIRKCLELIDGPEAARLTRSAVHQVARSKPDGAATVLLAFVAVAEDENVAEAARTALAAVAVRDGRADPALLAALKDADSSRRTLAAEALCRADGVRIGRPLLKTTEPAGRLALALALADLGDAEAIPALIDLLAAADAKDAPSLLDYLQRLAGPKAPTEPLGAGATSRTRCRDAWAAWWQANDAATLLAYFRERTPRVTIDQVPGLIAQLGNKSFKVRGQAERDLINLRGLAMPLLEEAVKNPDLELRRRAERCLNDIREAPDAPLSAAMARLLALRKPDGAAAALLEFAAFADNDTVVDDLRDALAQICRHDRRTSTLLLAALNDRVSTRRRVAVEALLTLAAEENLPAIRKLLSDPDATVRLRTAVGLGRLADRAAVPVLIDLLETAGAEQAWNADDMLQTLAGAAAPYLKATLAENRKDYRQGWERWWKENGDRVTLTPAGSASGLLGYTLVSQWSGGVVNEIVELGRDAKVRWKIEGLGSAFDFVLVPGNRLLLAEHNGGKVTERNFRGEILWQFDIPNPLNCQRLPNGHTFIAASNRVVIVDRARKPILDVTRYSIMAGQRLNDGQIVLCTGGECVRLDAQGNEMGRFNCGSLSNMAAMQGESNGRILIAYHDRNKVIEYDRTGKVTAEIDTSSPNFANRLPNGHMLIGSQDQKLLVERDRNGRIVWQYNPGVGVWRVRRR